MMAADPTIRHITAVHELNCDHCGRVSARVRGDVLIIESWHGKERHTTVKSLAALVALAGYRLVPVPRNEV